MAKKRKSNSYAIEMIMKTTEARSILDQFIIYLDKASKEKVSKEAKKSLEKIDANYNKSSKRIQYKGGKKIRITKKNASKMANVQRKIDETRKISRKSILDNKKIKLENVSDTMAQISSSMRILRDSIKADGRTIIGQMFKEHFMQVLDNINLRFMKSFRNGSNRHEMAINDPKFYQFEFSRNTGEFIARFANTDILDEYTSIYITRDGKVYEPPGDYTSGNVEGFWKFWEYTGVGAKTQFRSSSSYWFVLKQGWMNKKSYPAKPFITFFGTLFPEDEQLMEDFKNSVLKQAFERMLKSKVSRNVINKLNG